MGEFACSYHVVKIKREMRTIHDVRLLGKEMTGRVMLLWAVGFHHLGPIGTLYSTTSFLFAPFL